MEDAVPIKKEPGWYLSLMAPNVKGPDYCWLDPSRLYINKDALKDCTQDLIAPFCDEKIDLVAGLDAMGFILGAAIANQLQTGFLALRKAGHLCVKTDSVPYSDYSGRVKTMEIRMDPRPFPPGTKVLIVDQWVETGGTMLAAVKLIEKFQGVVVGCAAIAIENGEVSEISRDLQKRYKCVSCVPPHLQPQFDRKYLDSFKRFQSSEVGDCH